MPVLLTMMLKIKPTTQKIKPQTVTKGSLRYFIKEKKGNKKTPINDKMHFKHRRDSTHKWEYKKYYFLAFCKGPFHTFVV